MSEKVAVRVASMGSALAIAASLFLAFLIYHDINTLYVEIMTDVADFRLHAEDAWQKMMVVQSDRVKT